MDLIDRLRTFHPKEARYTFVLKCTWNIFKDRPHGRTQNKPQQIQENGNHIKHVLKSQWIKSRGKFNLKVNSKTLKYMNQKDPEKPQ